MWLWVPSRANLIRLQMLECLLLSFFSALPGLILAGAAIPVLRAFGPTEIRGFADVHLDPAILTFCLLVSLLTGLVFGLGPSWINTRRDPHDALKAGGRTIAGSRARRRMGRLFLSLQIALAMVLVAGTGLMVRSLIRVENVDLGYQPRDLLFLHLDAPSGREPAQFYDDVLSRLNAIPGVQRAGAIDEQFSDYVPDDIVELEGGSPFSKDLGYHLKTGHTLSVQNRPTGLAEDVIVLPCCSVRLQAAVSGVAAGPDFQRFWLRVIVVLALPGSRLAE